MRNNCLEKLCHCDRHRGKMCHLKISVEDRRLALVQPRNSIAGVAEDLQHLSLCETGLQPLIHQIDYLPSCKNINIRVFKLCLSFYSITLIILQACPTSPPTLTLAVVHKYEHLPYIPWSHSRDTGVQITNNILVTDKIFLQIRKHRSINTQLCIENRPGWHKGQDD